ncbi:cell division protein ZapA [Acetilactobacillus jinshanensis]|uniref:Cell division protein ZapA n=1 Tax=Acetilactobacillus jinshanensis TaxID=1720083 RepID=A0A4P6ZLT6_9LACO|nr:cell division protein ZapA [Acetilactobacillus jinshanensis]QBP18734.1 cell division protein ZapA [Acetilactobacillus jinshanensis]URL61606.1 cell division protein ZapA [uncultured bacterium]
MSNSKQERLKVTLDGHVYTFVGQSSLRNMKATAQLLQKQLGQIKRLSPRISDQDASILLAYNAISNQLKLQDQLDRMRKND